MNNCPNCGKEFNWSTLDQPQCPDPNCKPKPSDVSRHIQWVMMGCPLVHNGVTKYLPIHAVIMADELVMVQDQPTLRANGNGRTVNCEMVKITELMLPDFI